jgi:hypothetical protein
MAALAAATALGLGFAAPASAATPSQASKLTVSARATAARTALALAGCTVEWRGDANGGWYAGYSDTMTINTKKGQTGNRVKEVQCLLINAAYFLSDNHLRPGNTGADGDFGDNTKAAVVYAQKTYFFPHDSSQWDGEVGSKTWPKLRRATDYVH